MAEQIPFIAAALATGVGAKVADLPTAMAGVLAFAVYGVCIGVTSFLKVEVPKIAPKPKKNKKEKKAAAHAAAAAASAEQNKADEARKEEKTARKREKEKAKKAAKKEAAKAAEVAAKAAEEQAAKAVVEVKQLTKEEVLKAKKKKQKEKAKAKKAAAAAAANGTKVVESKVETSEVTEPAQEEPEAFDTWEKVKVKKGKKKEDDETVQGGDLNYNADLHIPRKHFGLILGPGGETLRTITEATGTEVDLPKEGGMRLEILISGSTQDGCNRAKKALQQLVSKGYSDITHAGTMDMSIAVPDNKRAVLIGSGGSTVQQLEQKLDVKVNIPEKGSDDDVTIVGDSKAVLLAINAIKDLMNQGYSTITHENYVKCEVEVARDNLRKLIGPGGATIKGLQSQFDVKINVPADAGDIAFVSILGETAQCEECRKEILELMVPEAAVPVPDEWSMAASKELVDAW